MVTISRRNAIYSGLGAFAATAAAPRLAPAKSQASATACIVLFMEGGPSQIDTFDPKPGRPTGGPFSAIATATDGVRFSEHLPGLARRAGDLAVLRSLSSTEGNHDRARYLMHTGYPPQGGAAHPGLGALVGSQLSAGPLPGYVAIGGPGHGAGFLGAASGPFAVGDPRRPVRNVSSGISAPRVDRRVDLWRRLQSGFGRGRDAATVDGHTEVVTQALAMTRAAEVTAFDLEATPTATRERYGDTTFGQGCLMARNLVEVGVPFVEVTLRGWDTHRDNFDRVEALSGELDRAMSALLDDLRATGLLDSTLVVWLGDFGRSPAINAQGGRGHYPRVGNAVLAGGGVRGGQVIGATDPDGYEIDGDPVAVVDLFRTMHIAMGLDPDVVRMTPQGRPITTVDGGREIAGLL